MPKILYLKFNSVISQSININFLKRSANCKFKSILQFFDFKQLIRTPTRITNGTEFLIDSWSIASNNYASIKDTIVDPCGIADHELVACIRKVNLMKFPEKTITFRDYRSYDATKLSEHLSEIDWNLIDNFHDVNLACYYYWLCLIDLLLWLLKEYEENVHRGCLPR